MRYLIFIFLFNISIYAQENIHDIVREGNMLKLKQLLSISNETIDQKNLQGYTPLHIAVRKNDEGIVKLLLEYQSNTNTQDDFGDTPLIDAVRNKNQIIIELLICNEADINIKNKQNKKALEFTQDPSIKRVLTNPSCK